MAINKKTTSEEKLGNQNKLFFDNIGKIKKNSSKEFKENFMKKQEDEKLNNFDDENGKFEYSPLLYNGNVISGNLILKGDGKDLGIANFSVKDNFIRIDTLISFKKGSGTQLIKKLVQISESLGKGGHIEAQASPYFSTTGQKSYRKQYTNLLFYYKLGFIAKDPDLDRIIQEYIDKGEEIPLGLNKLTLIYLTNGGIQKLKKDKQSTTKKNQEYFNGKSHKYNVTESQARSNSKMMDNLLNEINEQNKTEKLNELRKLISEQYKKATGEELNLSYEQLLSILDAHEQDGKLGELTLGQLRQKVKILNETIRDPKIRRFLLEAGFCGFGNSHNNAKSFNTKYEIGQNVFIPRSNGDISIATITQYDPKTKRYTVTRTENRDILYKILTQKDLDELKNYTINNDEDIIEIIDDNDEDIIEIIDDDISDEELFYSTIGYTPLTPTEISFINKYNKTPRADIFIKEGFEPKNKLDLGNGTILFTTDQIIDNGDKPLLIGYIIHSGQLHLRLFYKSKSEGTWRACPGMEEDGSYSKGISIDPNYYSYESTTKIDHQIGKIFDNIKTIKYQNSPILDTFQKYFKLRTEGKSDLLGINVLKQEMKQEISFIGKFFPDLPGSAVDTYKRKDINDVIDLYNYAIPIGLDYENMRYTGKSYSYVHKYLGNVSTEIYKIKRNGINLEFHFSRATNSPDKVRIDNIVYPDAKINSFGIYNTQINAGPLVGKPVDYSIQYPITKDKNLIPEIPNSRYKDIRNLYQGNPIIQKYKEISK